jgi:hypothetical protein
MADLLLGATNIATESSGTVTLQNATLGSTVTIPSSVAIPAAGVTGTLGSGVTFPAGHVLQVLTDVKTDPYSIGTTEGTFYNPTGLSVAITPVAISSKILVMCSLVVGAATNYEVACKITKTISASTSDVLVGDVSNSVTRVMFTRRLSGGRDAASGTMVVLDTPSTVWTVPSEIIYKPAIAVEGGTTIYLNTPADMSTGAGDFIGASQITVMEIAQ